MIQSRISEMKEEIENVIAKTIQQNYNFTNDEEIEYGYEFLEDMFNENAYVEDNKIYEDKTICYC